MNIQPLAHKRFLVISIMADHKGQNPRYDRTITVATSADFAIKGIENTLLSVFRPYLLYIYCTELTEELKLFLDNGVPIDPFNPTIC